MWRGIAVSKFDEKLDPEKIDKQLSKAIKKMFAQLPDNLTS